jgi:peptidoglycan/xylan/chitin deacetylase (PgdA/CDA1 family)
MLRRGGTSVNAFSLWLSSLFCLAGAFVLLPQSRLIIAVLSLPYFAVLAWGIFDLRSNFFVRACIRNKFAENKICLTFDDGPDPAVTGDILDLLDRFGFCATFFVVGEKAKTHPAIVKRAHAAQHLIACHDLNHSLKSNFRFTSALIRDISESQKIVKDIIGKKMLVYRPPVGLSNPHLATALAVCGMKCVGWSKSAHDAGNRNSTNIRKISGIKFKHGDVILLHDSLPVPGNKPELLKQLEILFERIKKEGFEPVGVDYLFDIDAYRS